jgi:hypothetical protein
MVGADKIIGAHHLGALDHVQADAAQPEHHHIGARFDLGGEQHRAQARRDSAAYVADLVEGRIIAYLGQGDLGHDDMVGKRGRAHVMVYRLAAHGETRCAVGHQALALSCAYRGAKVGLARQAGLALAAFGGIQRNDVITRFQGTDAGAGFQHHAGAFVSEYRRKDPFRISPGKRVVIRMADAGGLDLDQYFAGLGTVELDVLNRQWFACLPGNRCFRFHTILLNSV